MPYIPYAVVNEGGTVSLDPVAAPIFVAAGAIAAGAASAITPALPAGMATGDQMFFFVESVESTVLTIADPNGGTWTAVSVFERPAATSSRVFAFSSVYNGTQGDPTTSIPTDHSCGGIVAFRNVFDWVHIGGSTGNSTTIDLPGGATYINQTLVLMYGSTAVDAASGAPQITTFTNSDLTSVADLIAYNTNAGNGGGFGLGMGYSTAGAYGNGTATAAGSTPYVSSTILLFGESQ